MCTKPLPKWYYKYFVEYDENEKANHGIIYDKSFEELMRIHKDVKKGDNFSKEYYNEANIFSLYGNFFEYFCKSMKCIEDDRILLEQIRFLEYLLNDVEINCELSKKTKEKKDNMLITFLTGYKAGFINKIQRRYRKNMHKKKLERCLEIIIMSPPKQVEFKGFDSFKGGICFGNALENFKDVLVN